MVRTKLLLAENWYDTLSIVVFVLPIPVTLIELPSAPSIVLLVCAYIVFPIFQPTKVYPVSTVAVKTTFNCLVADVPYRSNVVTLPTVVADASNALSTSSAVLVVPFVS